MYFNALFSYSVLPCFHFFAETHIHTQVFGLLVHTHSATWCYIFMFGLKAFFLFVSSCCFVYLLNIIQRGETILLVVGFLSVVYICAHFLFSVTLYSNTLFMLNLAICFYQSSQLQPKPTRNISVIVTIFHFLWLLLREIE